MKKRRNYTKRRTETPRNRRNLVKGSGTLPVTYRTKVPISGTTLIFAERFAVRVIAKKTLREFWVKHPDSEQQLKAWYQEADAALWRGPKDIKKYFPSASFLADNRVVFNIKGNHYRLIVKINYSYQMVWIRFVGTHTQYDRIDANKI